MKKILIILGCCWTLLLQANVSKTVNITTAGKLYAALTPTEKNTVTNLTITGTIDQRDFVTMRDSMPVLSILDISTVSIVEYTNYGPNLFYPPNELPEYAFFNTKKQIGKQSLTSILLPTTLIAINTSAFQYCKGLTTIEIPSSVTKIMNDAFLECESLTNVQLPKTVQNVGSSAFKDCIELTSFEIPDSLNQITNLMLENCKKLTSITIPAKTQYIEFDAFLNCSSLQAIYVESSSPLLFYPNSFGVIGSSINFFEGVNKNSCILYVPTGSKAVYQKSIQWNSFKNIIEIGASSYKKILCSAGGLESLLSSIEKSNIETLAITGSIDARDFVVLRDSMPQLKVLDLSFANIVAYNGGNGTAVTSVSNYLANEVPQSAFYNQVTFKGKASLLNCILPKSTETIGNNAFENCSNLQSFIIPPSVTMVGSSAFLNCSNLKNISIPASVKHLREASFSNCRSLLSIAIPENDSVIDAQTFSGDSSLLSITIPKAIKNIHSNAFMDCNGLQNVYVNSTNPIVLSAVAGTNTSDIFKNISFSTCTLYVPKGSKATYQTASQWNQFTTIVEMKPSIVCSPGKLSSILNATQKDTITQLTLSGLADARDFITMSESMSLLSSLDISKLKIMAFDYSPADGIPGLVNINNNTFLTSILSLQSVLLPDSIKSIGQDAFEGTEIDSITIPNSVKSIRWNAFTNCKKLKYVKLPDSLSNIMDNLFYKCPKLQSITIPATVNEIGYQAFIGDSALTSIEIPANVTRIGYSAFMECAGLQSIYALNPVPVAFSKIDRVFDGINKNNCVLYVPIGSKVAYQNALLWKDFTNIVEIKDVLINRSIITMFQNQKLSVKNCVKTSSNQAIGYTLKDASIASISSTGVITSLKTGNTILYIINPVDNTVYDSTIVFVLPEVNINGAVVLRSLTQIEVTVDSNFPLYDRIENDFTLTVPGSWDSYKVTSVLKSGTNPNQLLLQLDKKLPKNTTVILKYANTNAETGVTTLKSVFTLLTTGIDDVEIETNLYPNPAQTNINIVAANLKSVRIYNMQGLQVATTNAEGNGVQLSIETLPAGVYVAEIITNNETIRKTFVKQ